MNDYNKNGNFNPFLFLNYPELSSVRQGAGNYSIDPLFSNPGTTYNANGALNDLNTILLSDWVKVN